MICTNTLIVLLCCALTAVLCVHDPENIPFDHSDYEVHKIPIFDAKIHIDKGTTDGIKLQLMKGIYWEEGIGNLIRRYARKGSVAVDAGSHIGIHSITMSRAVGPKGKVYSFEPQKKMYAEQLRNLEVNGCTNVLLYRTALGEKEDTINMCPYNPVNEGGQLVGQGGDEAPMITLDSLNIQNVSLIKADVEYYEYFVFEGAKETIKRCRPMIIFELLEGKPYDICPEKMKDQVKNNPKTLLESYGYTVIPIFGADLLAIPTEIVHLVEDPLNPFHGKEKPLKRSKGRKASSAAKKLTSVRAGRAMRRRAQRRSRGGKTSNIIPRRRIAGRR